MTTHLTDTQKQTIRIALARWSGWRPHTTNEKIPGIWWPPTAPKVQGLPHFDNCAEPPNYPASLDACHEIIRHLYVGLPTLNENLKAFRDALAKIKGCAWYQSAVMLSANAEEVSLALYLSLNLGELGD